MWAGYLKEDASLAADVGEEEADLADEDQEVDMANDLDEAEAEEEPQRILQPPSVTRLQASASPASRSSASTPSSISTRSSNAALGESSKSSKSSSNSSFFSLSRRSRQPSPAHREEEYPLFVTWNTVSRGGHKNLRGCIGTFDARELSDGLASYALTA